MLKHQWDASACKLSGNPDFCTYRVANYQNVGPVSALLGCIKGSIRVADCCVV